MPVLDLTGLFLLACVSARPYPPAFTAYSSGRQLPGSQALSFFPFMLLSMVGLLPALLPCIFIASSMFAEVFSLAFLRLLFAFPFPSSLRVVPGVFDWCLVRP